MPDIIKAGCERLKAWYSRHGSVLCKTYGNYPGDELAEDMLRAAYVAMVAEISDDDGFAITSAAHGAALRNGLESNEVRIQRRTAALKAALLKLVEVDDAND